MKYPLIIHGVITMLNCFVQSSQNAESVLGDENEQLNLFELSTHSPKKASTNGQKFLIFHHLYYKYQLFLFNSGRLQTRPPSQFVYIEGLPGIEKTLSSTLFGI
jgi:hypothetical protein